MARIVVRKIKAVPKKPKTKIKKIAVKKIVKKSK